MGRIRDNILAKLSAKDKTVADKIYSMHHVLMKEYGWIPLEEFKKLPMQTVNNLIEQINKQRKEENKRNSKGRKGRKK